MRLDERFYRVILPKILRHTASVLEDGGRPCNLDEEDIKASYRYINDVPLSRTEVCERLGVTQQTLTNMIARGEISKGRKRRYFKELVWYESEVAAVKQKRFAKNI